MVWIRLELSSNSGNKSLAAPRSQSRHLSARTVGKPAPGALEMTSLLPGAKTVHGPRCLHRQISGFFMVCPKMEDIQWTSRTSQNCNSRFNHLNRENMGKHAKTLTNNWIWGVSMGIACSKKKTDLRMPQVHSGLQQTLKDIEIHQGHDQHLWLGLLDALNAS